MISPSGLQRASLCLVSEALPHSDVLNPSARHGNEVHGFLALCSRIGREKALEQIDDQVKREAFAAIDTDLLPVDPAGYAAEVSFGWEVATGFARELGRMLKREVARSLAIPGEMVGTSDVVGLTADAVVIHDFKTGWGHVDPAEVNWQVRTYGLMAARAYKRNRVVGSIIRVHEGQTPCHDRFEMDALDLEAHEAELRALLAELERVKGLAPEKRPGPVEGEHCRYCPALAFCPAKVQLLARAMSGELAEGTLGLTPESAARAWVQLGQAAKLVERLQSVVKDYARQHPVDMGDGYILAEREVETEKFLPEPARAVLERMYGPVGGAVAGEATKQVFTMPKEALRESLRKLVLPSIPKGKITHLEREVHDQLRKGGAASVSVARRVEEFKRPEEPKKALSNAA